MLFSRPSKNGTSKTLTGKTITLEVKSSDTVNQIQGALGYDSSTRKNADLREDTDREDNHAGGREQRYRQQRQGQDPGQ